MTAQVISLTPSASPKCETPEGFHNTNWDRTYDRLIKGHSYKGLGAVMVTPVRKSGTLRRRFVEARDNIIKPPNHPFASWLVEGFEVGEAFNRAIWAVLQNPALMTWNEGRGPFLFTVEDDNIVPPDALVKLLADMHSSPFAAVSGLYFTKGEGGVSQCWGNPKEFPVNYAPQIPIPDTLQEVRGIGMGCAVWDIQQFLDPRNRQGVYADGCPIWFKTWSDMTEAGPRVGTQDLSYSAMAQALGYRFAVNTSVRVGHMDSEGFVW